MKLAIFLFAILIFPIRAQDLPEGQGKAAVVKLCSDCHGLAAVQGMRHTKTEWAASVDDMVSRGMKCSDEEFDAVVTYLAHYLGRVEINKAPSTEIQEIMDLTPAEADAIVEYRTRNGSFKDMSDLHKVPDVDARKLDERKNRIVFK
jgi:competence ComEA-like helix-hairpin-helix protein